MSKLVVLEIGEGDFEQYGFPVTLEIAEEGKPASTQVDGKLPRAPQVEQSYKDWEESYKGWEKSCSSNFLENLVMRLEESDTQIENYGDIIGDFRDQCQQAGEELSKSLNNWLESEPFKNIKEEFLTEIKPDEKIRIILQTDNKLLRNLPWNSWKILTERYTNAEIALSSIKYKEVTDKKYKDTTSEIKILAILGEHEGGGGNKIDVEEDKKTLKEQLPDATIEFLITPTRKQLNDQLWEQNWDILFFGGHSKTQDDDASKGSIKINENESLSIEHLKLALKKAIEKGLSLAIFNSCDGLGLAAELSEINIPQMIVMRKSIPDLVAQEFLKHFLTAFGRGQSLYLAVREARERLQGMESDFPCASWLPVIFQNPACKPPTLTPICKDSKLPEVPPVPPKYTPKWQTVMAISLAVTFVFLGVRHLGWLQPLELKAYDHIMQLRPNQGQDDRILVVAVTKDDIKSEQQKGSGASSLTVSTLTKLIAQIQKYKPKLIGLVQDLDTPDKISSKQNLKKLFEENPNLYGLCSSKDASKGDVVGNLPSSKEALGFSDVSTDDDAVLRRYVWYQNNKNSRCPSDHAFSLVLALQYLQENEIKHQVISNKHLEIGNVILPRLEKRAGGYQKLDARGYQMLLNYRIVYDDRTSSRRIDNIAKHPPVENFLSSFPPPDLENLVKDRIVLIGVTDEEFAKDKLIQTPYNQKIAPVWVHAQMVSQILSAVENKRPLLTVLSEWENFIWIFVWSFVGGLIVWRIPSYINVIIITGVVIFLLYISCFILFIIGFWVPLVPPILILTTISAIFIIVIPYWQKKKIKV
jgi:CHASE2 domain-containing sensor protein